MRVDDGWVLGGGARCRVQGQKNIFFKMILDIEKQEKGDGGMMNGGGKAYNGEGSKVKGHTT